MKSGHKTFNFRSGLPLLPLLFTVMFTVDYVSDESTSTEQVMIPNRTHSIITPNPADSSLTPNTADLPIMANNTQLLVRSNPTSWSVMEYTQSTLNAASVQRTQNVVSMNIEDSNMEDQEDTQVNNQNLTGKTQSLEFHCGTGQIVTDVDQTKNDTGKSNKIDCFFVLFFSTNVCVLFSPRNIHRNLL